jgi:ABC transporter substrate binding protein
MLSAARDLVGQKVDVVMVASNELAEALEKATATVPVVFVAVTDPVEGGLVASLARPAGNITGFRLRKVAALGTKRHREIEREAARLSLEIQFFIARQPDGSARLSRRRALPGRRRCSSIPIRCSGWNAAASSSTPRRSASPPSTGTVTS